MGSTGAFVLRLFCILAVVFPCAGSVAAGEEVEEVRHRNGLVLVLPADLVVTETADGFVVDPGAFRPLGPISVALHRAGADGDDGWTARHAIGDRAVSYRVDYLGEGGSGGAEYEITARESSALGDVVYTQQAQSELGEPDFALFWQIVDRARLPAGK